MYHPLLIPQARPLPSIPADTSLVVPWMEKASSQASQPFMLHSPARANPLKYQSNLITCLHKTLPRRHSTLRENKVQTLSQRRKTLPDDLCPCDLCFVSRPLLPLAMGCPAICRPVFIPGVEQILPFCTHYPPMTPFWALTHPLLPIFNALLLGQQDGSVGKSACCQAW